MSRNSFVIDTNLFHSDMIEAEQWGSVVQRDDEWGNGVIPATAQMLRTPRGITSRYDRSDGKYLPVYENEIDLAYQRAEARVVAEVCPPAIGAMENLVNYTMGKGFTFTVGRDDTAGQSLEQMKPLIDYTQRVVNEILDTIQFTGRLDREVHNVTREDGETFLWLRMTNSGGVMVQRLWPDNITEPMNSRELEDWLGIDTPTCWKFGIATPQGLTENPLFYHAVFNQAGSDYECIPASDMVHIKANVPRSAKRGVSDFWPVTKQFRQDGKLGNNLAETAAIQAAIAWIRQYAAGVTQTGVQTLVGANKTSSSTITGPSGSRTSNATHYPPGSILDIANGMTYLAGPTGMAQANPNLLLIKAMTLRMLGVRWQMPEYMISGDASNADYSSSKEAGHPFVKAREADQVFYGQHFTELLWKALRMLFDAGRFAQFGLSWNLFESLLQITVGYPSVATKDEGALATKQATLYGIGAISLRTIAEQQGLDYDQEVQNKATEPQAGGQSGADPNAPQPAAGGEQVSLNMQQIRRVNAMADQYVTAFKSGTMDEKTARLRLDALGIPQAKIDLYLDADPTNDPISEAIEGDVVVGKRKSPDVPNEIPTREQLADQVHRKASKLIEAMSRAVAAGNLKRAKEIGKQYDTLNEHAQEAAQALGYLGLFDPKINDTPREVKQPVAVIEPDKED